MPNSSTTPIHRTPRTLKPLVDATRALLSEGRLESATIEDIARRAGVSRRSVHNHFADRDALVARVLGGIRIELDACIAAALTGVVDPAERMALGLLTALRYGLAHRLSEKALLRIAPHVADPYGPGMQRLAGELQAGQRRGVFLYASLDAAVVLVLGLSDVGLAQLQGMRRAGSQGGSPDEPQDDPQGDPRAVALMHALCVAMLQGLRVTPRRVPAAVDAAMRRLELPWRDVPLRNA